MEGFPTPEDAACESMPAGLTHVVVSRIDDDGRSGWVLLAVEVAGTGYYLDENLCERLPDGSWIGGSSCGSGFTDHSIESLRADPPPQGIF
jgi:hypothetical protein